MEIIIAFLVGAVVAFAWAVRNVCKANPSMTISKAAQVVARGDVGGGGGPIEPG